MPELPEVEFGRKVAENALGGRQIVSVELAHDPIVFDGVPAAEFQRTLEGAKVVAVHRRGKHLWFELDRRPWPTFHFGMTGAFRVPDADPLVLEGSARSPDRRWPPRFAKIRMTSGDGRELAMTNARRLGRIRLREDPANEPPIGDLGFDPLTEMPRLPDFRARFARRRGILKGLLLDQTFAAGVGNWIADEVLYQARLDPRRRTSTLTDSEVRALHEALKKVVRRSVSVDADKDRFPASWLFHHRWGKGADARMRDGAQIRFLTIAGRTTAWVPSRQR